MKLFKLLITACLASCSNAYAQINEVDRADVSAPLQMLANPGFEAGRASWTASGGTVAAVTSGTNLLRGKVSVTWDSSAAAQTLSSTAVAVPRALFARNGEASCLIMTPSGTATHLLQVFDGTNVIASQAVTSSTTPTRTTVNFAAPSSGNLQLRLNAVNSNEPLIAVDDCYMGEARNIGSIAQASYVGGMEQAGAAGGTCLYAQNTSTALNNFVSLGTGTGCNAWTVEGAITAVGTNDHRATYNNMPAGRYLVVLNGTFDSSVGGTSNFRLTDGTNNFQSQGLGTGGQLLIGSLSFHVSYTSAGNRTFTLQGSDGHAGATRWLNETAGYTASWKFYRFPDQLEIAFRPDLAAYAYAGYHNASCDNWSRSNVNFGDYSGDTTGCALVDQINQGATVTSVNVSGILPAISFTPTTLGLYEICAQGAPDGAAPGLYNYRLWNQTTSVTLAENAFAPTAGGVVTNLNICGYVNASSLTAQDIRLQTRANGGNTSRFLAHSPNVGMLYWTVKRITQGVPMPVMVGSVSSVNSAQVRIEGADVTCSAASSIVAQSGAVSAIGNRSSAACTLTLAAGVFSATPWSCVVTPKGTTAGSTACTCASSTSCTITGPSAADYNAYVQLQGQR